MEQMNKSELKSDELNLDSAQNGYALHKGTQIVYNQVALNLSVYINDCRKESMRSVVKPLEFRCIDNL